MKKLFVRKFRRFPSRARQHLALGSATLVLLVTSVLGLSAAPAAPSGVAAPTAPLGLTAPTSTPAPSRHTPTPMPTRATPGQPNLQTTPASVSHTSANVAGGTILWSYPIGYHSITGGYNDPPPVVNGVVYTSEPANGVYALNATTGALLWHSTAEPYVTDDAPTVANGAVYVSSFDDERVFALNTATGDLLWLYQATDEIEASPAVAGGIVYAGARNGHIYALDAATGALLWSYQENVGVIGYSPVVVAGVVYVSAERSSNDTFIFAFNATTGALLWSHEGGGDFDPPAVVNGVVYTTSVGASTSTLGLAALNAATGTVLWTYQTSQHYVLSFPEVAAGVVYFGLSDGGGNTDTLYAVNAAGGALLWSYTPGTTVDGLVVADGIAYYALNNGTLYAVSASNGSPIWQYSTGIYLKALVVAGVVYVGTYDGLSALDAVNGALLWNYTGDAVTTLTAFKGVVYVIGTAPNTTNGFLLAFATSPPAQHPAQGPTGTERQGGANPSELACYQTCAGDPVDTYSGNFDHTIDALSIPGRGIPLDFSLTYNAGAAAQNGPLGYGWTDAYRWSLATDSSGNVTITQENGSTVAFAPNGSGGYSPPSRVLATLVKNSDGTYTFTREQTQDRYIFDASGRLIKEIDRNGYVTSLTYNGAGQLTQVTDSAGRTLALAYDGSGRITTVTDPGGRHVAFAYDAGGNLQSYTNVAGGVTSFSYDASHYLLTMTDPRGGVVTNAYDSSGRVTSQTDALNRTTTFSYTGPDSSGNSSTTITDPRGNVSVDQYYNGLLLSETRGYGTAQAATWSYTYDPLSLGVASLTDPNGNITSQIWDASGNLLSSTDPLGRATSYTYDAMNDLLTTTDANGVTTTHTYDMHGNLLTTTTALGGTGQVQTISYTYGDASHPGDLTAMTNPDSKTWHYAYDTYGYRSQTTDPLGNVTKDTFNVLGERVSETNALGSTTTTTYDAFGDVASVTDPLKHTTSYQYDADRNQIQMTDADGNVSQNSYDLDNELTKVARADGTTLSYTYDGDGNRTTQADGLGHATIYAYDLLNRLISLTDPLNRQTTYTYDAAGNQLTQTSPDGLVTTNIYDAANELIGISYSDGQTPNVTYTYDSDGRRLSMKDGTGTTSYVYDSLGRLTSSTDGAGNTLSYGYDLAGNLTSVTYPGGSKVTRGYDDAGRLTSLSDWLGQTTRFSYDQAGELTGITYPDHIVGVLVYNLAGQLVAENYDYAPCARPCSVAWRLLVGFVYTRDPMGMLTSTKTTGIAQPQQTYTYTSLNQLASVVSAGGATSYTYDKGDEPTQLGTASLTEDAAGEVTQMTIGGSIANFTYDARGNRTQAAGSGGASVTYTYDQANRLTRVAGIAAGTTTYAYNGDGLRMSKTVGSAGVERFVWDVAEGLPLLVGDGAITFVTGPGGLPIEQITGSGANAQTLYLLTDQLNSVRALADTTGTIVATYTYDAYGAMTAKTGTATTPLQFAGQYEDAETGFYYLRARYYDPVTAQFLCRDPLVPLTKQPYLYASDNPLNATDPSGESFWSTVAKVAGKIADVTGIAATACGVGGLVATGTIAGAPAGVVLEGCALIAGGISASASYVKLSIDMNSNPDKIPEDFIDFALSAGGEIGDAVDVIKDARLWQKIMLYGWDAVDTIKDTVDLFSGSNNDCQPHVAGGGGGGGGW